LAAAALGERAGERDAVMQSAAIAVANPSLVVLLAASSAFAVNMVVSPVMP
jgi:hypothetical protein